MRAKASDAAEQEGLVEDPPGAISVRDNFREPPLLPPVSHSQPPLLLSAITLPQPSELLKPLSTLLLQGVLKGQGL